MKRTQHIRPLKKDTATSGTSYPMHSYSQTLIKRLEGEPLSKRFYLVSALQALAIAAMMSGTVALYASDFGAKKQTAKPTTTERVARVALTPKKRTSLSCEEKEKISRNFVFFLFALSAIQVGRFLFQKPQKEKLVSFQVKNFKPENADSQKTFNPPKPASPFFFKWTIRKEK